MVRVFLVERLCAARDGTADGCADALLQENLCGHAGVDARGVAFRHGDEDAQDVDLGDGEDGATPGRFPG